MIRKYVGGVCTTCGGIPVKKVIWEVGNGDKFIEWFCEPCFQKNKSELHKRFQNINFA